VSHFFGAADHFVGSLCDPSIINGRKMGLEIGLLL
jgi:hypothetical protein